MGLYRSAVRQGHVWAAACTNKAMPQELPYMLWWTVHCPALILLRCAALCVMLCSAVIGEVDEEVYDSLDLDSIRAAPLRPIAH